MSGLNVLELDEETQKMIIQQYENIRASCFANMFNYADVKFVAEYLCCDQLFKFMQNGVEAYSSILENLNTLMRKFNIQQF